MSARPLYAVLLCLAGPLVSGCGGGELAVIAPRAEVPISFSRGVRDASGDLVPESRRQVATPEFDNDLLKSGVRPLPSAEAAPRGETPTTPPGSVAATPELAADVTRPAVAAASPAVFRGAAPTAKPATFGDLLDDSLGL